MTNPTTPNNAQTPAAGGRFVGMRRRVTRAVMGKLWCDQCGNPFDGDRCEPCAQRRHRGGGLETAVETWGAGNTWSTLDRSDETDGDGWTTTGERSDDGDETGGWPW